MSGVNLESGARASELFFAVLERGRAADPEAFEGLAWPKSQKAFRRDYAAALIAFERRRLASPRRAEIARAIVEATAEAMVFAEGERETPLSDYLRGAGEPLSTETVQLTRSPGLVPELTFRGRHYRGSEVSDLADDWHGRHWMTDSAHQAIRWTLDRAKASPSGRAELVGHKCVTLGGGAELSPTRAMLRAGADVLYLDTRDPGDELTKDPRVSGTLTFVPGGADLLTQPREIAATIERFAGGEPIHLGMYAYSGGAAKEWRLTSSMTAIARALPKGLVRSVVMLISPTTPGTVSDTDAETAAARKGRPFARPLGLGSSVTSVGQSGDLPGRVSHSIVSLQGASYQAAQYVGKMMTAEALAVFGLDGAGGDDLAVSAPVAPITKTASLAHPLFEAGFEGADLWQILVSEPQATRVMCALLAFHDLLNPEAPSRQSSAHSLDRVAAIMGEQIHGGVYAQAYALEREIMLAAVAGFGRKPSLLPPALRFLVRGA